MTESTADQLLRLLTPHSFNALAAKALPPFWHSTLSTLSVLLVSLLTSALVADALVRAYEFKLSVMSPEERRVWGGYWFVKAERIMELPILLMITVV